MSDPITVTPDLTKAIQDSLNPDDIRAAVQAEINTQTVAAAEAARVVAETAAATKAAVDKANAETTGFTRTEVIGGKEFTFEAATELELERAVNNALKIAYAVQTPAEASAVAAVVDPTVAQQAAEEAAEAKVELELKFKRGEIDAATYIEQSGAMTAYLAKQGIPVEALRDAVTHNQETAETQSWAEATEEFLHSPAGADWPGGQKNLGIIGDKLAVLGLTDAKDKVAALGQAWSAMRATGSFFPEAVVDAVPAPVVAPAAPAAPAAAAAALAPVVAPPRVAATSSALFGASSGVSGIPISAGTTPATKIDVPANATPEEILDAWKKGQIANGKNPDAAFMETFAAPRG
jgi:hypothetical protein